MFKKKKAASSLRFPCFCFKPDLLKQMLNGIEPTFLLSVLFHKLLHSTETALSLEQRHTRCKKSLRLAHSGAVGSVVWKLVLLKVERQEAWESVVLNGALKIAHWVAVQCVHACVLGYLWPFPVICGVPAGTRWRLALSTLQTAAARPHQAQPLDPAWCSHPAPQEVQTGTVQSPGSPKAAEQLHLVLFTLSLINLQMLYTLFTVWLTVEMLKI